MSSTETFPAHDLPGDAAGAADTFPPPRVGSELLLTETAPHRAHAWWHLDPADLDAARERAASSPLVIRLHDVTGITYDGKNPHDTHDTVVHGDHGQSDLHVRKTRRTYLAEIGLRRPDGHLELLATSERLEMQSEAHQIPASAPIPPDISALAGLELAGILSPPRSAAVTATEKPSEAAPWPDAAELGALVPDRSEYVEAWFERFSAHGSAIEAAQKQIADEVANVHFEELPSASGLTLPVASAQLPETPVAPTAEAPVPVSSSTPQVIRLEDYLSAKTVTNAAEDIVISAELLIHGRIPRGRRATLFGQEIAVDETGAFEVTCDLPGAASLLAPLHPQLWGSKD